MHRDLKPENILITQAGGELDFVKVIDFGIARHATDVGMTRVGEVAGTPQYIAPEVASGAGAGARADVYALGAVLYYLLTGTPPFGGPTPAALLLAAVNEPVVPPSLRAPGLLSSSTNTGMTGPGAAAAQNAAWSARRKSRRNHTIRGAGMNSPNKGPAGTRSFPVSC